MEYEEGCECVELEYSPIPHPACPLHGEDFRRNLEFIEFLDHYNNLSIYVKKE